jgi:uncharacterized protein YbjT (DUF2867 family)
MTETTDPTTGDDLTLVLGGTGKTGTRVARRLASLGRPVRAASRRTDPTFDWDDPATWDDVLQGVTAAYVAYYPDLGFPGAADAVAAFARLAAGRGVQRLVLLSGRGEEEAQRSEEAVRAVVPDLTVVRASWFMQNFSEHFLLAPVLDGVIALPAGDVAEPFVDVDDVAAVAVVALTEDGHAGRTYELTGPRLLSFADVAAELTRATGREIVYLPVSSADYEEAARAAGVPDEEIAPLTELFENVLDGRNASVTGDVEAVLGRPPTDFAAYARAAAGSGVWDLDPQEAGR